MKNLSKVFFIALLVLVTTQTFAQRFGVQAGVNIPTMVLKDNDINYGDEFGVGSFLGFNAGVNFEMGFGSLFAVEVAAIANTKGFQMKEGSDKVTVNLLYADIPVLLKVGPSFGPAKVFAAVGPYVGMGLTGKYIVDIDGEKDKEDVSWGSDAEDDSKRLDFGAKFGIGAEISGFTLGAYYNLGLANTATVTDNDYKESHRFISVSVGYKFGK